MAKWNELSPKTRKGIIYSSVGMVGILAVVLMAQTTEEKPKLKEPETVSLTGKADLRALSIEGMNQRLLEIENGGRQQQDMLRNEIQTLQTTVRNMARAIEENQSTVNRIIDQRIKTIDRNNLNQIPIDRQAIVQAPAVPLPSLDEPRPEGTSSTATMEERRRQREAERQMQLLQRERDEAQRRAEEAERQAAARERNASIYTPVEPNPMAMVQQSGPQSAAAPIKKLGGRPTGEDGKAPSRLDLIPDVQLPAGSILSAYLLTGVDAPTGTRASQQPVPVLMRIKPEAILPNYAAADVKDCHMLGAAAGDLGSERVQIRGETMSCILKDNTAVEAKVKFYVAGDDGKNGIKGTLVTRSGRIMASAAMAALTQGVLGALDSGSQDNVFLGGSSGNSGAISGASKGFDLLTEYYIDLAEQTFPVIEVPNGSWVDIITTEMVTIKFKG
ncbi:hypothetical protein D2T29_12850 [Sinirhodobacter populi]|uniref:Conjugal transfer protein TraB n=1 Tax=Paenirhodobacter populi TaxID=2306993 RepID=A0A443KCN5_9RHOB|nr:TraB/VirB10 family protein [Sinirhodobacter populi]RWR30554.1 hypothetical protein D2T29_12850 [Sinirhodobacter populi]